MSPGLSINCDFDLHELEELNLIATPENVYQSLRRRSSPTSFFATHDEFSHDFFMNDDIDEANTCNNTSVLDWSDINEFPALTTLADWEIHPVSPGDSSSIVILDEEGTICTNSSEHHDWSLREQLSLSLHNSPSLIETIPPTSSKLIVCRQKGNMSRENTAVRLKTFMEQKGENHHGTNNVGSSNYMKRIHQPDCQKALLNALNGLPKVTEKKSMPPKDFNTYMTNWLRENWTHPYIDDESLQSMSSECGKSSDVICNWLINARTRRWRTSIEKAVKLNRPAAYLHEDSINLFDRKPIRDLPFSLLQSYYYTIDEYGNVTDPLDECDSNLETTRQPPSKKQRRSRNTYTESYK